MAVGGNECNINHMDLVLSACSELVLFYLFIYLFIYFIYFFFSELVLDRSSSAF